MAGGSLRHSLAVFELAAGLVGIGISAYYLIEFQFCNPNAALCKPLAMLPVVLLLVPGIIVFGAGALSIRKKALALWKIQVWMVTSIVVYVGLLAVWIAVYAELRRPPPGEVVSPVNSCLCLFPGWPLNR